MFSSFFQVDRILARTAVAAAVAVGFGLAAAPQQAQAVVIYSGTVNLNVPTTTSGIYLNVVTGVFATAPASAAGWDINPWGSSSFNVWANNAASAQSGVVANNGTTTLVDNLPLGYVVGPALQPPSTQAAFVRTGSSETTGGFAFLLNSSSNYIGFKFLDETDNLYKVGWAHFSLAGTTSVQPRTLIDYAYESDSTLSIIVGDVGPVPEPSALALMSLGGAGLLAMVRRRQHKAQAAARV
jgi:hypothetical protein